MIVALTVLSVGSATLFKYKYEKKQELLDHLKGKRALSHGYDYSNLGQFTNGGYFGFTDYEALFKHAFPLPYPVAKAVPIQIATIPYPHPVPVPITKTITIPVPFPQHLLGKSLGDYGLSSAYDAAYANYAAISQQHQQYQQQVHNGQHHQHYPYHHHHHSAPVYEQDCHPYCDINLPQGSSPVPLTARSEKKMKADKVDKVDENEDMERGI